MHIYIYMCIIYVHIERGDRQTDRQGDRETHRERQEQTETERDRESHLLPESRTWAVHVQPV